MKPWMLALIALLSLPATGADTPGTDPNIRAPSVDERLAAARRAIADKDWSAATRELAAAQRADPRNADVHNLLGYSWRKRATPDLAKAIEHYQTALKLDPKHKGAHEYLGEAYLMKGQPAEAEKHLAVLEQICGNTTCEEYLDLAKSIAQFKAKR